MPLDTSSLRVSSVGREGPEARPSPSRAPPSRASPQRPAQALPRRPAGPGWAQPTEAWHEHPPGAQEPAPASLAHGGHLGHMNGACQRGPSLPGRAGSSMSLPTGVRRGGTGVLTVGSQVDQQQAHILRHLRVVLVQLVRVPDEAEAAALLIGHHHPQRRQLCGARGGRTGSSPAAPLSSGKWGEHKAGLEQWPQPWEGTARLPAARTPRSPFPRCKCKACKRAWLFPSGEGMVLHSAPCEGSACVSSDLGAMYTTPQVLEPRRQPEGPRHFSPDSLWVLPTGFRQPCL